MKLNQILLFISVLFLFSCEKEIVIDTASLPSKIVVEGTINLGESPFLLLKSSAFLYGTIDETAFEKSFIHGATVIVSNGTLKDTLVESCFKNHERFITTTVIDSMAEAAGLPTAIIQFQLFQMSTEELDSVAIYYGTPKEDVEKNPLICVYGTENFFAPKFVGEVGKTYDLEILSGDERLTASTKIETRYTPTELTYEVNEDDPNFSQVFIDLIIPDTLVLGHYIQYGSKIHTDDQFFFGMRTGSVYSDATFDGSSNLSLPLEGPRKRNEGRPLSAERQFKSGDTVTLIWKNIDKSTYEFINTKESDGGASPFSSPTKIISNINGGLGIWAGYNTSYKTLYIP